MKKVFLILLAVLLVCAFVVPACAAPSAAPGKTYNFKIQSAWPRGDVSMETLKVFAESAAKRSNGSIKIEVFAAPELVGMFDVAEAVKAGTLDLAMGAGNLWSGVIPVGDPEFGMPWGYKIPEKTSFKDKADVIRNFFFKDGFIDLLRSQYATQGVYYLDIHVYGPVPFMVARKPIRTVSDLKGLKIRTDGLWMEWNNACGMTGVDIPGDEAYMALKQGTVDAHIWDLSVYTGMGIEEVAPYWIHGFEGDDAIGHILVNQNVWNSLPDDMKKALVGAGEDYYNATVQNYGAELQKIYDMAKAGTITEVSLDADAMKLLEQTALKIWDEVASRDAASAQAVDMIKKWRGIK
jgi:TRAP-type mannitol/chloroaromatic compound transport system substrate-binding protein